jgi:hypothetical protein
MVRGEKGNYAARKVNYAEYYAIFPKGKFNLVLLGFRRKIT